MSEKRGRPWKPGESGNPGGRPPGTGEVAKLRAAIGEHVPEILERLVEAAREGDVQAARLLLERVIPPVKPAELPAPVPLSGDTFTDRGRAVLAAIEAGTLAPSQGASLLQGIGTLARVTEIDELTRRVEALEGKRDAASPEGAALDAG